MQRKQKQTLPPSRPVSTPGKARRVKKKQAAISLQNGGMYRTTPRSVQTPGAVSFPIHGLKGRTYPMPRGLSADGLAYLKCAFAPPDFSQTSVAGVPDNFEGTSLVKKHRGVFPSIIPASVDRYILLLPTPGFAYWQCDKAAGQSIQSNDNFIGVPYSDYSSMFESTILGLGSGANTDDIVDRFRFASNHIEIVPTVNATQWTGSIQVWKAPINLIDRPPNASSGATGDYKSVSGLQSVNATNANQYTAPFNLGCYVGAYNSGAVFGFNPINSMVGDLPVSLATGDFGRLLPRTVVSGISTAASFTGLDNNYESVIIKISGVGTNPNNSYVLKTWACVEYQVVTGSSLYEYQTLSPCDPIAMKLYREIIKQLPVGVTYMDNDTFWERVLGIIRMISGGLSFVPGPIGTIAGGVHAASTLFS